MLESQIIEIITNIINSVIFTSAGSLLLIYHILIFSWRTVQPNGTKLGRNNPSDVL
jgi:hypothetical protein